MHVNELGLAGTDDVVILDRGRDDDRVLATADHDFVQMLFASGDTSPVACSCA
jgi:predicted nuclease of predicted toxin-antitoxin system